MSTVELAKGEKSASGDLTEWEVNQVVEKYCGGIATAMVLEYGIKAMAIPGNMEAIKANLQGASRRALQSLGVLDDDCKVVPGHEKHANRWGFGKEE